LTDASAEAEGLARKARQVGYLVVDVPLSLLRERAAVQPPALVLLDADAEGMLEILPRLRELPAGERIVVFAFGASGGPIPDEEAAHILGITKFFTRPVDEAAVIAALEGKLGPPPPRRSVRPSTPPAPQPQGRSPSSPPLMPPSSQKAAPRSGLSLSPLAPMAPAPLSGTALLPPPRSTALLSPLSPELEQMLSDAEHRVHAQAIDAPLPSPEEEIEAVLPAELLEALDEPIDDDEDDELDAIVGPAKGTGGGSATTGASGTGVDRRTGAGERLTSLRRERDQERERAAEQERERELTRERELARERELTRERELARDRELAMERERDLERAREIERDRARDVERERARELEREREREREGSRDPEIAPKYLERPALSRDSDLPPTPRDGRRVSVVPTDRKSPLLPPRVPSEAPPRPSRETSPSPPVPGAEPLRIGTGVGVGVGSGSVGVGLATGEGTLSKARVSEPPPAVRTPGKGTVLGATDAPRVLADAIAARQSGAMAFASEGVLRRVLLREGDVVTVASGAEDECLVAFLQARGELRREDADTLRAKLPPFGRHAGAALVAHGHLRQDQLWPVLRAHAEWLLSRCLRVSGGTAMLESEPAGRLKTEPNVFGGSPGVATFVEAVRRVFEPHVAAERLGGERVVLGDGDRPRLVLEAHLDPEDLHAIEASKGKNVSQVLATAEECVPVAYALVLLGALSAVRGLAPVQKAEPEFSEEDLRALDEDAIRARVRARMAHVEEGDYFAVLGIAKDATGYEVRKAFLQLRRELEPSRLLTPRTADLREDLDHIVVVLEEAYEVLRDAARRERYRRAIDAPP